MRLALPSAWRSASNSGRCRQVLGVMDPSSLSFRQLQVVRPMMIWKRKTVAVHTLGAQSLCFSAVSARIKRDAEDDHPPPSVLEIPVDRWTQVDVQRARAGIDRCLRSYEKNPSNLDRPSSAHPAVQGVPLSSVRHASRLYLLLLQVFAANQVQCTNASDHEEAPLLLHARDVMHLLHRVLHAWRAQPKQASVSRQARYLVVATREAGVAPLSDTAYSMMFAILAKHDAGSPRAFQQARELRQQRRHDCSGHDQRKRQYRRDVVFWNSYLHLLSKCSPSCADAAAEAEFIVTTPPPRFTPTSTSWAHVLTAWCKRGTFESVQHAQTLLDQREDEGALALTISCYVACLKGWAAIGDGERAEALLKRMMDVAKTNKLVTANASAFLAVMTAWGMSQQSDAPNRVLALVQTMESLPSDSDIGLTPEMLVALVQVFANYDAVRAQALLDGMEHLEASGSLHAVRVLPAAYEAVLHVWAATQSPPDSIDSATATMAPHVVAAQRSLDILRRLQKRANHRADDQRASPNYWPNSRAYAAVMTAWARCGTLAAAQQAQDLLDEMRNDMGNRQRDVHVGNFNAVLLAYKNCGMLPDAFKLYHNMKQASVSPNATTYGMLLQACGNRASEATSSSPSWAQRARWLITNMEQCCANGTIAMSNSALEDVYRHFLYCVGKLESVEAAEEWLVNRHQASSRATSQFLYASTVNTVPSTKLGNVVLSLWCESNNGGAEKRAARLLRWLERPNAASYGYVMRSWARSGRREAVVEIQGYMDEMRSKSIPVPISSYNHYLNGLIKSGWRNLGARGVAVLQKIMESNDVSPVPYTFHLVLSCCLEDVQRGDLRSAQQAFITTRQMLEDSGLPENAVTRDLIQKVQESVSGAGASAIA